MKNFSSGLIFKKRFRHKEQARELFVLLPPWGGRFYYNHFLKKSILRNNYSVLEYEFPKEILSSDWEETIRQFLSIRDLVLEDIKALKARHNFLKISLVGVSLGSFSACMVAEKIELYQLCLVLVGDCLAEVVWQGNATRKIKKRLIEQGVGIEELKINWQTLAPKDKVKKIQAKKIFVYLGLKDKTVPVLGGLSLVDKMPAGSMVYQKIHKHLGHRIVGILFYLFSHKALFRG